jgi:hypothetical protein
MTNRIRSILQQLEQVREDLLALSDDIWLSIDHNDSQALQEGVAFKKELQRQGRRLRPVGRRTVRAGAAVHGGEGSTKPSPRQTRPPRAGSASSASWISVKATGLRRT